MSAENVIVSIGGLIVDDIVVSKNGPRRENILGGSGVHATVGMSIAGTCIEDLPVCPAVLVAKVGSDFQKNHWKLLADSGVDLENVTRIDGFATPHALQDFSEGFRKHIWISSKEEFVSHFRISNEDIVALFGKLKSTKKTYSCFLHFLHFPAQGVLDAIDALPENEVPTVFSLWEPVPTAFRM
mmetsp:Transcript_41272/g.106773  ORF Transcript_41272/g.106773 Transcript_41272/m.106773 type:complete len:184 (-) Transcript_41272:649-1200(-)